MAAYQQSEAVPEPSETIEAGHTAVTSLATRPVEASPIYNYLSETREARYTAVTSLMTRLADASPIYNYLLSDMVLVSAVRGQVITRLKLTELHVNSKGSLHGAVSATIIDFTTGLAIASWDLRETTGASVDMHISYLSGAAGVGDSLEVESRAERVGGSLAFVTIKIVKVEVEGNVEKRTVVTMGQHTKYVRGTGPPAAKQEQVNIQITM